MTRRTQDGDVLRAEEALPVMVDRLHEVKADLFALDDLTPIELPRWIAR